MLFAVADVTNFYHLSGARAILQISVVIGQTERERERDRHRDRETKKRETERERESV